MAHRTAACAAPSSTHTFVDLGMSPPCESYLSADQLDSGETFYPLHVRVCSRVPAGPAARLHRRARTSSADYAYFSSYSDSWVAHAERVRRGRRRPARPRTPTPSSSRWPATTATCCSTCVARGIRVARDRAGRQRRRGRPSSEGIPTEVDVPRRGDRRARSPPSTARPTSSSPTTSSPTCPTSSTSPRACGRWSPTTGTVSIEIPHLLRLIEGNEYDTIYHEHFSYLSLLTTQRVLAAAGLTVVDVEELPTHGGSLRTWSMPDRDAPASRAHAVAAVLAAEAAAGLHTLEGHAGFAAVGGDGAQRPRGVPVGCSPRRARRSSATARPGKGNTLLNHCGIRADLIAVHRRPQPVQARQVPARHAHPDPPGRSGSPRRAPTTC